MHREERGEVKMNSLCPPTQIPSSRHPLPWPAGFLGATHSLAGAPSHPPPSSSLRRDLRRPRAHWPSGGTGVTSGAAGPCRPHASRARAPPRPPPPASRVSSSSSASSGGVRGEQRQRAGRAGSASSTARRGVLPRWAAGGGRARRRGRSGGGGAASGAERRGNAFAVGEIAI